MRRTPLKIIWSKRSLNQFRKIYDFVKVESPQGAETVREAVIQTTEKIKFTPLIFEEDRFKLLNDGSYRAFVEYHIRVTYRVKEKEILILKITHTSQMPRYY